MSKIIKITSWSFLAEINVLFWYILLFNLYNKHFFLHMYDNPPYHGQKREPQNARELCIQYPRRINGVTLLPKESGKIFSSLCSPLEYLQLEEENID